MTAVPDPGIRVVNRYRLLAGREAFVVAAEALAERVRAEGHPGILDYRFYCPPESAEGRLLARYADAAAWVGHHDLAMKWDEMVAFRAVAALEAVDLHGAVTPTMRDWIQRMGLAENVRELGQSLAGFSRASS
jgi:Antibiotic biosynthesis monooxygenase